MSAYAIYNCSITDPEGFADYAAQVGATVAAHGGSYRVRGGDFELVEGTWQPHHLIVIEFPDMNAVKAWYNSPDYAGLRALRQDTAIGHMIFIEGAA